MQICLLVMTTKHLTLQDLQHIPLDSSQVAAQFGSATFSTTSSAAQFVFGGPSQPLVRQSVEGSGFSVALRIKDGGETAPYSLKGFQLEYLVGARR